MNNQLSRIVANALPALSGSSLTYNAEKNVYLTLGHTSQSGNTYYKAMRLSDKLGVIYELGQGYAYTFLNGIKLFCWDGQKSVIIAQKFWGGCGNWCCFSERFAKEQSIQMLKDYLAGQVKLVGGSVNNEELTAMSRLFIEDTQRKQPLLR